MSPWIDFVFGLALLGSGVVMDGQNSRAHHDAEVQREALAVHSASMDNNNWQGTYYQGQAEWEKVRVGETRYYKDFLSKSDKYFSQAEFEAGQVRAHATDLSDAEKAESLYRGTSIMAFSIGGVFIVKAIIGFFQEDSKRSKEREANRIKIEPLLDPDGAELVLRF